MKQNNVKKGHDKLKVAGEKKFQAFHSVLPRILLMLWYMQVSTSDKSKNTLQIRTGINHQWTCTLQRFFYEYVFCKSTRRWGRKEDSLWSLILEYIHSREIKRNWVHWVYDGRPRWRGVVLNFTLRWFFSGKVQSRNNLEFPCCEALNIFSVRLGLIWIGVGNRIICTDKGYLYCPQQQNAEAQTAN